MFLNTTDYNTCHVYNRGVEKRDIFLDENDYSRFQSALTKFNIPTPKQLKEFETKNVITSKLVSIHEFCLMPNHYHLLLTEEVENGIPLFLHRIGTSYSKYFNYKYSRTGTLFESNYKSTRISNDEHFTQISRYILLNPLSLYGLRWKEQAVQDKTKARDILNQYKWSSLKPGKKSLHIDQLLN